MPSGRHRHKIANYYLCPSFIVLMAIRTLPLFLVLFLLSVVAGAQKLKPGFSKNEYIGLLNIYTDHNDSTSAGEAKAVKDYKRVYRSPVVGLDNRWSLYMSPDSIAVISIRGTTSNTVSWMENFYAAMVAAQGQITLADSFKFNYKLADNPRAAVHIGWLIGMAFLSRDMLPVINRYYQSGIKDFIIFGHSQGGAISYLITSYFYYLKKSGTLPQDITFKTYCSAAPKPGNLYYAYDYEYLTYGGWGYNVVNTADWVPETPVSVQTVKDHNTVNPFTDASDVIKKQKFPKNVGLAYIYGQLKKPANKAHRRYEKYFGYLAGKSVKKNLKGYVQPQFYPSSHYVRAGTFIILKADEEYHRLFPDKKEEIFIHHLIRPYLYLASKLPASAAD